MRFLRVALILLLLAVSNQVVADLKIRFWSDRDGGSDSLFVMNPDGSDPVNVNKALGMRQMPVWSPDRTKIANASHNMNKSDIFVMNADGSNLRELGPGIWPKWSQDSTMIGCTLYGIVETAFIVNANGFKSRLCFESAITLFSVRIGGETPLFFLAFQSPIFAQFMTLVPVGKVSHSTV